MKKLLVLVVAFMMLLCCSLAETDIASMSDQELKTLDNKISEEIAKRYFSGTQLTSDSGLIIEKEYKWVSISSYRDNEYILGIVIRNMTGHDTGIEGDVVLFDEDENILAIKSIKSEIVGQGYTIYEEIKNDTNFDHAKYYLKQMKSIYKEGNTSVNFTTQISGNKVFLFAENIGEKPLEFFKYTCYFFKDDKLVGYEWGYLADSDSQIKPGCIEMSEESCKKEFDTVDIYYEVRMDK